MEDDSGRGIEAAKALLDVAYAEDIQIQRYRLVHY